MDDKEVNKGDIKMDDKTLKKKISRSAN